MINHVLRTQSIFTDEPVEQPLYIPSAEIFTLSILSELVVLKFTYLLALATTVDVDTVQQCHILLLDLSDKLNDVLRVVSKVSVLKSVGGIAIIACLGTILTFEVLIEVFEDLNPTTITAVLAELDHVPK